MGRRRSLVTETDVTRIVRGYRKAGLHVRTRVNNDGSIDFEPYELGASGAVEETGEAPIEPRRRKVL